jgi:hypothetical protein
MRQDAEWMDRKDAGRAHHRGDFGTFVHEAPSARHPWLALDRRTRCHRHRVGAPVSTLSPESRGKAIPAILPQRTAGASPVNRRPLLLISLLGASFAGMARAACPLQELEVVGFVRDADGAPIAGAAVEASWEEKAAGTVSTRRESVGDGSFLLRIAYDTYSGKTFTGKDKCETRIATAALVVTHEGHAPLRRSLELESLDAPLELTLTPR